MVKRRPPARPHWLQQGGQTRTPRVVVSFDTETVGHPELGESVQVLRCWDAAVRVRQAGEAGDDLVRFEQGEASGQLARTLESATGVMGECWAFAHNLGFDLTVTSLPMVLEGLGWQAEFVNIGEESCVFVFRSGIGKLVLTDSWSWLRCSLGAAASDVGMRKTRLPGASDDLARWHDRCRHDVQILDRLLADLLAWWDSEDLGSFGVTSSACGWRSMRRMIQPRTVLVGPDGKRTRLEREAIFGGRKEVWRVGEIRGRWVEDWDLVAAHLTAVANLPMPARPLRPGRLTRSLDALAPPSDLGTVCRVRILTRTPCAPVRAGEDVWWPVGKFQTVLTSPELAHVLELADQVEVLDASWYWLTDDLQAWGSWCTALQGEADELVPRVVKRVAKGWGRSVPGRFALQTHSLIAERPATHLGWALETGHDLDTGDALEIVTYGGVERTYRKDQDGADVSPVVLAFVEGYVRACLGRVLSGGPASAYLQCNTDGWWQFRQGRASTGPVSDPPAPWRAARKATARSVVVRGPNHLEAPGDRRLSGVPKDAATNLDGSYSWQDWPGLRWQLQNSRPGEYLRPGRELMLQDHYCRRWVLATGETVPVTVTCDRRGVPVILPWSLTAGRLPHDELASHQVSALRQLVDDAPPRPPRRLSPGAAPLGRS